MSSPCSVPELFRTLGILPLETPEQQAACRRHDADYARGGSRRDRLEADLRFCWALLRADMAPETAELYLWAVRMHGGGHWPGGDAPGALPPRQIEASEAP